MPFRQTRRTGVLPSPLFVLLTLTFERNRLRSGRSTLGVVSPSADWIRVHLLCNLLQHAYVLKALLFIQFVFRSCSAMNIGKRSEGLGRTVCTQANDSQLSSLAVGSYLRLLAMSHQGLVVVAYCACDLLPNVGHRPVYIRHFAPIVLLTHGAGHIYDVYRRLFICHDEVVQRGMR